MLFWFKKKRWLWSFKKNVMVLLVFGYQMWNERKIVQLKMSVFSLQQLLWILIDFGFHWTSKPVSKFYACQFLLLLLLLVIRWAIWKKWNSRCIWVEEKQNNYSIFTVKIVTKNRSAISSHVKKYTHTHTQTQRVSFSYVAFFNRFCFFQWHPSHVVYFVLLNFKIGSFSISFRFSGVLLLFSCCCVVDALFNLCKFYSIMNIKNVCMCCNQMTERRSISKDLICVHGQCNTK